MKGPLPWDPYQDAWGLVPWVEVSPAPYSGTQFKYFKISDSDSEGEEPGRVQWTLLEPESSFDEE